MTTMLRRHALGMLLGMGCALTLPLTARAHDFRAGDLVIDHPYATPSIAGSSNGAAYLRGIRNKGKNADRLIGASTPAAARVELHEMKMEGDIMHMREVPFIELPAGQEVQLRHGQSHHLMLIDLKQPLREGDRFDLTLQFEKAGEYKVKVWVQQPKRMPSGHQHPH
ncbi:copper chaperone PCu(A)C [Delftia acidovorans]|uniref:copper chaperone PCu(A)C n=1 Tax=Delftia acidovorans TaxID=80866 RepID=UPI00359F8D0A